MRDATSDKIHTMVACLSPKVRERSWEFAALLPEDESDLCVVERTFINVTH